MMKKKVLISVGIMLSAFIVILSVLIALFAFVFTKDYWVSREDSFVPYTGAIDVYNASREDLIEFDMCDYPGVFGEVKDEKEAVKIASQVIEEIYGKDESPYIVKFNENANAWIVNGTLSPFRLGGVASIAIDRTTGEVLMLIHTK